MREILFAIACCLWTKIGAVQIDISNRDPQIIPDRLKNTADFTRQYGYPAEQHDVATEDGYTLTIFRIPRSGGIPVLLQHGVYLNSDHWVLRGAHDLPFLLYERGFDVWMGNSRGTRYSSHKRYSLNNFNFWTYSSDDIALKDLPVLIDYVLNTTRHKSLSYIGHSRGSAGTIMLLSDKPEYNEKIHMLQLLAPVIYTKYAECPIYYIASNRTSALMSTRTFAKMMSLTRTGRVLNFPPPMRFALKTVCSTGTPLDHFCPFLYFFINGEDFQNFNYTLTPKILDHFSEGMSTKEVLHLQQISSANKFQKFDYGRLRNKEMYGSDSPPEYNISAVQPPIYIYYGSNDLFISKKDLSKFMKQIRNLVTTYLVPWPRFNHLDYFWGNNANTLLFPVFLKHIEELHQQRVTENHTNF